jgi:hypothetical protein
MDLLASVSHEKSSLSVPIITPLISRMSEGDVSPFDVTGNNNGHAELKK